MLLGFVAPATADLVSPYGGETAPNFAEATVFDDRVRVALEIDTADYPLFVAPDTGKSSSLAARTGHTFKVAADGADLTPVTVSVDVRERPERISAARKIPVTPRPRSRQIVYVELDYPFSGRPGTITLTPPADDAGRPRASIGLLAKHGNVPVTDYRYLSQAETMLLSWDDPWFTAFENPNLTRHHKSPLMSFIAVEPREVRHEIIVRLRDLERWIDLELGEGPTLDADALAKLEEKASIFFTDRNPIVIDGAVAKPQSVRIEPISVSAAGLTVLDRNAALKREGLLFGAVQSYPVGALPQNVHMTWELFPDQVEDIPVTLSDPAGGVPGAVQPDHPSISWTNHLKTWEEPKSKPVLHQSSTTPVLPMVGVGLLVIGAFAGVGAVGTRRGKRRALAFTSLIAIALAIPVAAAATFTARGAVAAEEAQDVMTQILSNISAAMVEVRDDGFKAALSPFVPSEHMEAVSAEIARGLSVTLPSGARARTEGIADIVVEAVSEGAQRGSSQILLRWVSTVGGGHWGHLHRRNIAYRALADIVVSEGVWQLVGLTVLGGRPVG